MTKKNNQEFAHLDFKNHIHLPHGYLMIPTPDEKYKCLPGVYDRVCSIIYFASKIGDKSDRYCISNDALSAAMFRASLSEFIALDEYIMETYSQRLWLNEHKNADPIFHMLKLLRNYNVHIANNTLDSYQFQVTTLVEPEKTHTISKHYISNVSITELQKLNGASRYRSCLNKMIEVFEAVQHEYGIDHLIMHCAIVNMKKLDTLLT